MDELSDIPEVENHIATLDTEVKGFAEGLPYWAKYLAEKILSCNAITDIEINLFWFSVNWRIRPFELACKNGGNHHAQTAKKLHANREGLHTEASPHRPCASLGSVRSIHFTTNYLLPLAEGVL